MDDLTDPQDPLEQLKRLKATPDPLEQLKAMKPSQGTKIPGLVTPGNIDLTNRPHVRNSDGSVSTVRSIGIGEGNQEVVIPTVSDDGRVLSNDDAIALYKKTGRHLGKFADISSANAYAQQLHQQQAAALLQKAPSESTSVTPAPVDPDAPGLGTKALGVLAAVDRDIPGAEAVQAGARSAVSHLPSFLRPPGLPENEGYVQARDEIRGAEDAAPAPFRKLASLAGGTVAALALPGSAAGQGAALGAANGALDSDPTKSLKERAINGTVGGLLGAAVGKFADKATTGVRAALAPELGTGAFRLKDAMKAADDANYGRATDEGTLMAQHFPSPPDVAKAMTEPDIEPYVSAIKASRSFAGADDPTVLREAYKLMSERQGRAIGVLDANDFKAGTQLQANDIGLAKEQLRDAAGQVMPSFPGAIARHAELAGEQDAYRSGSDAARRAIGGSTPAGKKLTQNSTLAFQRAVAQMTDGQAEAATQGVLERARPQDAASLSFNPLTRVNPLLRSLDAQLGKTPTLTGPVDIAAQRAAILRAIGLSAATPNVTYF